MTSVVKQFYDINQFPGHYTRKELNYHIPTIKNPFLNLINESIQDCKTILDVGCGSGLITNLFAIRNPNKKFTAVEFANGINYAQTFAQENLIKNVKFYQEDFLNWRTKSKFDCVVCQGVLHHIPDWESALDKLMSLVNNNGVLILGVYHPLGKLLKKYFSIDYQEDLLYIDQELNPFELSFTKNEIVQRVPGYELLQQWPSNTYVQMLLHPIQFSRNGGLTTYIFKKL